MTRTEALESITGMLSEILDLDNLTLYEGTAADSIDGWDSINHVKLLIGLEEDLGVEFAPEEVEKLGTVKDLVDLLLEKVEKA
jgi:acyl carrier protein